MQERTPGRDLCDPGRTRRPRRCLGTTDRPTAGARLSPGASRGRTPEWELAGPLRERGGRRRGLLRHRPVPTGPGALWWSSPARYGLAPQRPGRGRRTGFGGRCGRWLRRPALLTPDAHRPSVRVVDGDHLAPRRPHGLGRGNSHLDVLADEARFYGELFQVVIVALRGSAAAVRLSPRPGSHVAVGRGPPGGASDATVDVCTGQRRAASKGGRRTVWPWSSPSAQTARFPLVERGRTTRGQCLTALASIVRVVAGCRAAS